MAQKQKEERTFIWERQPWQWCGHRRGGGVACLVFAGPEEEGQGSAVRGLVGQLRGVGGAGGRVAGEAAPGWGGAKADGVALVQCGDS